MSVLRPPPLVVFSAVLLISLAILGIYVLPILKFDSPGTATFALGYVPSCLFLFDDYISCYSDGYCLDALRSYYERFLIGFGEVKVLLLRGANLFNCD